MLKKICLAVVFGVFIGGFCFSAAAQEKRETGKYSGSIGVGTKYFYKFTEKDFADTPSWNVADGEPPISITRALQIANTNLPRFVESSDNWKARRVVLQSLNGDKWFYQIMFICPGAPCRNLALRQFSLVVKMDGSILEPKKLVEVN